MPSTARGIEIDYLEQSSNNSKKDSFFMTFASKETHAPTHLSSLFLSFVGTVGAKNSRVKWLKISLIHPSDKIRVLLVNTLNHEEPVYLFLEGEKTYVAYRRFMLGEP